MELQPKRVLEERSNDCRKIMDYINSLEFATLDDREVRALVLMREISSGIVHGQNKLAAEGDISRILKISIERMVSACRKTLDEINRMDFKDLNEPEKDKLLMISKIGQGFIPKEHVSAMNLHGFDQEDEVEEGIVRWGKKMTKHLRTSLEVDNHLMNKDHWVGKNVTTENFLVGNDINGNVAFEMKTELEDANGEDHGDQLAVRKIEDGCIKLDSKDTATRISFGQRHYSASMSFGAVGISNPPSWNISLEDDASGTELVVIPNVSEVEGLPLPSNFPEPHKSNYEYLFDLIARLKHEVRRKDDQLKQYKQKLHLQYPSATSR